MATDQARVDAIDGAMAENVGVRQMATDNVSTAYEDPEKMLKLRDYFGRRAGRASGKRPILSQIDLSGQ